MAHPTWVETQNVMAGVSGMNTDSMVSPSARVNRNFCVPSDDCSRAVTAGVVIASAASSCSRTGRDRSVIPLKRSSPRRWIQRYICRAWNRSTPSVETTASSSAGSSSAMSVLLAAIT